MTLSVAVLAGGLGTRLQGVTGPDLPKVLVPVLGRPFIDFKLEGLAASGVQHVVLLVGHHGAQIEAHVGDGHAFGLSITCIADGPELRGTGGALLQAVPVLGPSFWITYGDTLLDFDVATAEVRFLGAQRSCLMTVLRTVAGERAHTEESNARVEDGMVVAYSKNPRPVGAGHIDYGMLALRRDALDAWSDRDSFDLADVLEQLSIVGEIMAFEVSRRFHDVGTAGALADTEDFLRRRGAPCSGPDATDR